MLSSVLDQKSNESEFILLKLEKMRQKKKKLTLQNKEKQKEIEELKERMKKQENESNFLRSQEYAALEENFNKLILKLENYKKQQKLEFQEKENLEEELINIKIIMEKNNEEIDFLKKENDELRTKLTKISKKNQLLNETIDNLTSENGYLNNKVITSEDKNIKLAGILQANIKSTYHLRTPTNNSSSFFVGEREKTAEKLSKIKKNKAILEERLNNLERSFH